MRDTKRYLCTTHVKCGKKQKYNFILIILWHLCECVFERGMGKERSDGDRVVDDRGDAAIRAILILL